MDSLILMKLTIDIALSRETWSPHPSGVAGYLGLYYLDPSGPNMPPPFPRKILLAGFVYMYAIGDLCALITVE